VTIGSKNGAGIYHRIIGWMPPHALYVEPFAGTAAVFRHKRPAAHSVLIDSDPAAIGRLAASEPQRLTYCPGLLEPCGPSRPGLELLTGDGLAYLRHFRPPQPERVVVYCDPPYWRAGRRDPGADYYGRNEWEEAQHVELLDCLADAPFLWLLSGLSSPLYRARLRTMPHVSYTATTRGGTYREHLWANFDRPETLHDPRYAGADYRQRERMAKRQARWLKRLEEMPAAEREAMLAAIDARFEKSTKPAEPPAL
jgi:hypothetical protein